MSDVRKHLARFLLKRPNLGEGVYIARGAVVITGMNLGGATNVAFLRDGQADTNVTLGFLMTGAKAANIQLQVSLTSNTPPGTLTVFVRTPVGTSTPVVITANRTKFCGKRQHQHRASAW